MIKLEELMEHKDASEKYLNKIKQIEKDNQKYMHTKILENGVVISCKNKDRLPLYEACINKLKISFT